MTETDIEYRDWARSLINDTISAGSADFAELVEQLPGIYPGFVLETLKHIQSGPGDPHHDQATALIASAQSSTPNDAITRFDRLLPPHPLDFEWRFSDTAISRLVDEATVLTPSAGRVALVATPSIAVSEIRSTSNLAFWYFGRDADTVCQSHEARNLAGSAVVDLGRRTVPAVAADTVIIDPPWYDEYMLRFIWFCAAVCNSDGHVLLSLPPVGTRPGMQSEYARYRKWWELAGFTEMGRRPGFLPYASPPFERNALRAAGITHVRSDWRKADLVILRRVRSSTFDWPGDMGEAHWNEVSFGPVRLRIDTAAPQLSESTDLRSVVGGDVLASVSRRSALRQLAAVWTSGNRIFACDDPGTLLRLAECLKLRLGAKRAAALVGRHIEPVRQTLTQLSRLVLIEQQELGYEKW
ncbi:hypothetical protein [Paraburkholderia fungorum]|uniref:Uncharacterized protein n=1 Tax=Paraburkholderia fungorum TaxID=134537 RepID=A0A3R7GNU1_9BURK|nr:hypothetical protein [Paraburkholderia fungorum]RKF35774.1 hypothetical protein BCY88_09050 [Paraburkholderia fungorum]